MGHLARVGSLIVTLIFDNAVSRRFTFLPAMFRVVRIGFQGLGWGNRVLAGATSPPGQLATALGSEGRRRVGTIVLIIYG
jgi:hypothetical protein